MNYGSPDEDEDLQRWIEMQANNAALSGLLEPDDYQQQGPPSMSTQMPELQLPGPDWSDALGAGISGLAAIADLAGNHGRGTGQILSSAGAYGVARGEQRVKQSQDMLNYEEKRASLDRQNKYNDYLLENLANRKHQGDARIDQADQRIEIAGENAGTKSRTEARQGRKETRDTDATSDYAQPVRTFLEERGIIQPGEYNDLSYEQIKQAKGDAVKMWEYDHAGDKAKATRGGAIAADVENAGAVGDVKADQAGKVAAAQAPYRVQVAGESAQAREVGQQRGKEAAAEGSDIPGLVVTDRDAALRAKADAVTKRKLLDMGGNLSNASGALKEMLGIRKQFGTELASGAKTRFDMAQATVNAALSELGATKTLSDNERKYYMDMIPKLTLSWKDALRPGGQDIVADQLAGAVQEFDALANGKLKPYGHGVSGGAPTIGAPPPQAGPQMQGDTWRSPYGADEIPKPGDASVPKLGTRSDANGAAPIPGSASDEVMMKSSATGQVGPVPRDRVQQAIAAGWKVVK